MVNTLLYKFLIAGVDVTSYILSGTKINLSRENVTGNTCSITISETISEVLTLTAGQEVIISRGVTSSTEDYKFKGNIKEIDIDKNVFILKCKDFLNKLQYDLFIKSYDINIDTEAGEISAIFADIVTDGGFTPDVVNSGTAAGDILLDKYKSKRNSRLERINVLSKILAWIFYYDYNTDKVRLEPRGYVTYSNNLVVGENIYNNLKWIQNIENMRNKVTVEGAFQLDNRKETETGDDSSTEFDFTYTPVSVNLTVDGVLQKLGIPGSSDTYDFVIDVDLKTYTFEVAPAGGEAIVMNYVAKVPTPVEGQSDDSIATYGLTQGETYKFSDVVTVDDAETRVSQILNLLKDGTKETTIHTDEFGILPGYSVEVEDKLNPSNNGTYIVREVIINYPEPLDVVKIGDESINVPKLFQSIEERIGALEKATSDVSEILRHVFSLAKDILFEKRYSQKLKRTKTGAAMIFDDVDFGTFDVDLFDGPNDSAFGASQLVTVVQGNNIYKERFYDIDFKGITSTPAPDWDLTNKRLAMSTDDSKVKLQTTMQRSGYIGKNGNTFTSVKFTATETRWGNDVIKYLVNCDDDDSHFEEITLNTTTELTYPGDTPRWMALFTGVGGPDTYIEDLDIQLIS